MLSKLACGPISPRTYSLLLQTRPLLITHPRRSRIEKAIGSRIEVIQSSEVIQHHNRVVATGIIVG